MKKQRICLVGRITGETVRMFSSKIRKIESCSECEVYISSDGGETTSARQIVDLMRSRDDILWIGVAGSKVCSAALLPFMACHIREAESNNSLFVFHRTSKMLKKPNYKSRVWEDSIFEFLSNPTTLSAKAIKEVASKNRPMSAKEAKNKKVVSKIRRKAHKSGSSYFILIKEIAISVGVLGFEPRVACSQNRNVSRYTTPRGFLIIAIKMKNLYILSSRPVSEALRG